MAEATDKRMISFNAAKYIKPLFASEVKLLSTEKGNSYLKHKNNKTEQEYQHYTIHYNKNKKVSKHKNNENKIEYFKKFLTDMLYDF